MFLSSKKIVRKYIRNEEIAELKQFSDFFVYYQIRNKIHLKQRLDALGFFFSGSYDDDSGNFLGGKVLRRLVDEYPYVNQPESTIIPLIGGMGSDRVEVHSNQIAHDLSRKMRAKCKYLYVPALVDSRDTKKNLVENVTVKDVLEDGKKVDFALVGIASPFSKSNTMTEIGYIDKSDITDLAEAKVIGDVNSRFFDRDGNEVRCRINENVMGINLRDIRKIEKVCAICFEDEKKDVLYTSIDSRIINCITLTDVLAEYLLDRKSKG